MDGNKKLLRLYKDIVAGARKIAEAPLTPNHPAPVRRLQVSMRQLLKDYDEDEKKAQGSQE